MSDTPGRVVIVAPSEYDANVPAQSLPGQITEVAESIKAFFQPVVLQGRVTAEKFYEVMRKGAKGFWFAGHVQSGDDGGFVFSDGVVSARSVGRYLARAGVEWSYLNTCDSGALIVDLQAAHPHDVYANITFEIDDKEATNNGVLMAQGIADTGQVKKAYRWVVSGGASKLRMFPSPATGDAMSEKGEGEDKVSGGTYIGGDAKVGGDLTGRDSRSERQQQRTGNMRAGDNYFGGSSGSDMQMWMKILEMADQIRGLATQLDDLPGRVGKLERTEVVVRPGPEVLIRPAATQSSDSVNLSLKVIYTAVILAISIPVLLVIVLVILRLNNA